MIGGDKVRRRRGSLYSVGMVAGGGRRSSAAGK